MTELLELALTHGGFTSLDRVYLENKLKHLSPDQALLVITPPPSVINAYFAEHYQKTSPQAALDYLYELSLAFNLFQSQPSFVEDKPFIRLNLAGRSLGLCFADETGRLIVFAEDEAALSEGELLGIAELFPQLFVWQEEGQVYLAEQAFDDSRAVQLDLVAALLTEGYRLSDQLIKLTSFNREELLEVKKNYPGQAYYGYHQRQSMIYILES